jgi:segregation and condensation protein B
VSDIDFAVRLVEALLFASPKPLSEDDLAARLPAETDVKAVLTQLAEAYAGRGVQLTAVAGGWAIRTAPDLAAALRITVEVPRRLSRAAVEALSIIAYHQPVTRGEIEEIRGVALSKGSLEQLLEAAWIKPRGHKQTPGRPALWVTTDEFLLHFGLANIDDLPGVDELKAAGLLDRRPSFTTLAMRENEKETEDQPDTEEAEIQAERDQAATAELEQAGDDGDDSDDDEGDDDDDDEDEDEASRAAGIAASPVREPV